MPASQPQSNLREYNVAARSTGTFGRVLCSARNHHLIVDGPVQNGCPGEELTPPEVFLFGVASCGVELLQVMARAEAIPLQEVKVNIEAKVDRDHPVRKDVTVFNSFHLRFDLSGVTRQQADTLVEAFKGR